MVEYDVYFKGEVPDEDDFMGYYDEVDIMDFKYIPETGQFTYPCPCGDVFIIGIEDLRNGETIARCMSCSLVVMVVYDQKDLIKYSIPESIPCGSGISKNL